MIKRGDIYYVNSVFPPATGCEQRPGRPAIVVSNNANNTHCDVVDVVYLTTKEKVDLPTHCKILSGTRESTALCEHIDSVSTSRLGDLVTVCSPKEMAQVNKCLRIALALDHGDHMSDESDESVEDSHEASESKCTPSANQVSHDDHEAELCSATATISELQSKLIMLQAERDVYKAMYTEALNMLVKAGGK